MSSVVLEESIEEENLQKVKTFQVSACTRFIPLVRGQDSLYHALHQMKKHQTDVLIIERDVKKYSFITKEDLLAVYCEETSFSTSIYQIAKRNALFFSYCVSCEEVLNKLSLEESVAVILDVQDEYMGMVTLTELLCSYESSYPKPVGGVSTPFGIYLTNGGVSAGVSWWCITVMGVLFVFAMQGCFFISYHFTTFIFKIETLYSLRSLNLLPGAILCFLILFRLSPLAGIHGAEHMVIHALERGEPLEKDYVIKMPRIHTQCGTNLSVSLISGLGVYFLGFGKQIASEELGLGIDFLIATAFMFLFGTILGNFIQLIFTTKNPSRSQLNSAIDTAKKLNIVYREDPFVWPYFFKRVLKSGIIWIFLGFGIAFWVLSKANLL